MRGLEETGISPTPCVSAGDIRIATKLFPGVTQGVLQKQMARAHICGVPTEQLVTWESDEKHTFSSFGHWGFYNLQIQMKTGAATRFCLQEPSLLRHQQKSQVLHGIV